MRRLRITIGLLTVAAAASFAAAPASANCGLFGLRPCPPPAAADVNPDGSLAVWENPYNLAPLPRPVPGQPLYPRVNGHLYFGLTDNALDEDPPTATPDEVGGIVESLGGSFVRLALYWPVVEYAKDTYNWGAYDREYRALIKHGVRPLWIPLYTPQHAVAPGTPCWGWKNNSCDAEPADTPAAQAELQQFAHDLAVRYPLAAGFEYRNEENLDKDKNCTQDPSWRTPPDVYVRGLRTFAAGIRSGRPAMRVIGGALSNCTLWQDDLGHRLYGYLDAMLAAGAADSMDALSWHPYDNSAGFTVFEPEVDGIAATLRVAGHADMRIVAGEVGSAAPDNAQSNRLTSEYTRLDARDSRLDLVGNYDMFAGFVDVEKTNPPAERAYGWVTQKNWLGKFQAKRVFCDFRDLLGFGRPVPKYVLNCPLF